MKRFLILTLTLYMSLITVSCSGELGNINNPDKPNIGDENIYSDFTFERLFLDSEFKSITIEVSKEEWNNFYAKQLANYRLYGTYRVDEYMKADLIYSDDNGEITIGNIGIRNRGNTSLNLIRNNAGEPLLSHWKVSFKHTFDDTIIENKDRSFFDLNGIDLKYNKNENPNYLAETFSLDMFNEFNVNAQQTSQVLLFMNINGVKHKYGLYTVFEPVDEKFIEKRFKNNQGNLYKSLWQGYGPALLNPIKDEKEIGIESINYHPSYDLKTNKKTADHKELISFIENINSKNGTDFYNYIKKHFNVEQFLMYIAVNSFLGNPDDYRSMGNNYYLYHDDVLKKWHMIPYDFDHSLGVGWNPTGDYTINSDIIKWFSSSGGYAVLWEKIIAIKEFKDLYISSIKTILNSNFFTFNNFYTRYTEVRDLYNTQINDALSSVSFGRGAAGEYYINSKIESIKNQLLKF